MHATSVANGPVRPTDGQSVNWRKANRQVRTLRQRIFRARQAGDLKKVRSLQKLMPRSYATTLVSVRRVTQVNRGRNTPGVDKLVVNARGQGTARRSPDGVSALDSQTRPTGVHTKSQRQTPPALDPLCHRPLSAGTGQECA